MKKLYIVLGLAGMVAAPNVFANFDGTVTLNYGPYNSGGGGEFSAATVGAGLGTFLTFCIEDNEYFVPGGTYSFFENTGAVRGGADQLPYATDPHTGLNMDTISLGTAWLYSQFRSGGIVINSAASAGNLQNAIWMLEDEVAYNPANTYLTLARGTLGKTDAQLQADSGGAYGVIALNLYSATPISGDSTVTIGGQTYWISQDQLAMTPEPTTVLAGALLLLPLGASTLRILRKNRVA